MHNPKKFFFLLIAPLIFMSCSYVKINSVVDQQNSKKFKKILVIFPEPQYLFDHFTPRLEKALEVEFLKYHLVHEFFTYKTEPSKLELNSNKSPIPPSKLENKDLLLIINPWKYSAMDGLVRKVTFEVVGISMEDKKEVWKSVLEVFANLGPSSQKEKIAQGIVGGLAKDGLIE
jgi:hypothetical protein